MNTHNAEKYIETQDGNGRNYVCLVADDRQDSTAYKIDTDECFDKDVVERYAGNIDIARRDD